MKHYILEGQTPKLAPDIMEWTRWFEKADRHVGDTQVGKLRVSTVFLGLDHSFTGGTPILFETMIFGAEEEYQERYATWQEAEAGHQLAVQIAEQKIKGAE